MKQCPSLASVENAMPRTTRRRFVSGDTVNVQCMLGYKLATRAQGSSSDTVFPMTCINGEWSPSTLPVCERKLAYTSFSFK